MITSKSNSVPVLKKIPKIIAVRPAEGQKKRSASNKTGVVYRVVAVFNEFFSKSTIHGMRYITEQRRHWIEKFVFKSLLKLFDFTYQ